VRAIVTAEHLIVDFFTRKPKIKVVVTFLPLLDETGGSTYEQPFVHVIDGLWAAQNGVNTMNQDFNGFRSEKLGATCKAGSTKISQQPTNHQKSEFVQFFLYTCHHLAASASGRRRRQNFLPCGKYQRTHVIGKSSMSVLDFVQSRKFFNSCRKLAVES